MLFACEQTSLTWGLAIQKTVASGSWMDVSWHIREVALRFFTDVSSSFDLLIEYEELSKISNTFSARVLEWEDPWSRPQLTCSMQYSQKINFHGPMLLKFIFVFQQMWWIYCLWPISFSFNCSGAGTFELQLLHIKSSDLRHYYHCHEFKMCIK